MLSGIVRKGREMSLRYRSKGEVHKDFHRLLCATCRYLSENYGPSSVMEVVEAMAKGVYKTMHEALKNGDCGELCEYWEYYLTREGGDFEVEQLDDGVRLTVRDCPAQRHLRVLGDSTDAVLCDMTRAFNEALADDSPFDAMVMRTGEFSCVQEFKRKTGVKQ